MVLSTVLRGSSIRSAPEYFISEKAHLTRRRADIPFLCCGVAGCCLALLRILAFLLPPRQLLELGYWELFGFLIGADNRGAGRLAFRALVDFFAGPAQRRRRSFFARQSVVFRFISPVAKTGLQKIELHLSRATAELVLTLEGHSRGTPTLT